MGTICILNLNIWNYNEPWTKRRELIVELISQAKPDIVALQETRYQDWLDAQHQADQILSGLNGYRAVWQPAAYWAPGQGGNQGQQWEGLAILSLHPIIDHKTVCLAQDPDDPHNHFPRRVLGAQIRTPAGRLWLFDTHFPLSAQARARVAPIVWDFVTQTAGGLPFALTGDFNAEPAELPIQFFTGQAQIGDRCGNLTDAWALCHPGKPGYTFAAWDPRKRIDYVLVSPGIEVEDITIVGTTPDREAISPSDHCGLLARLKI